MSIIGALRYGSLFLHRDDLLKSILTLPEWDQFNQGKPSPIIINFVVKPFKSDDLCSIQALQKRKKPPNSS